MVLVAGPTGSGKTTTLYAALQHVNNPEVKIITVEDPVEYQLDGVTQIPVNPKAGRTFATALRSILRHDPDIIMVGEMRDRETAEIAIQAALTGHLVFSTLHTNDAPSAVTRLVDMGVEPFLVSATVQGLLAQRLVRIVCDACGKRYVPSAEERGLAAEAGFPLEQQHFRKGLGCDACGGTGYRGRTGVYELMVMTDALRDRVVRDASLEELRTLACSGGMRTLHGAAWEKACTGLTTPEEVLRVTQDERSP
jgi:type II secretory ATPase GspE/PulE/Tfp pilus assembly ATPase PilB-like protein